MFHRCKGDRGLKLIVKKLADSVKQPYPHLKFISPIAQEWALGHLIAWCMPKDT